MVEAIRSSEGPVLVVDGGAAFDDSTREKADVILKAMDRMGYGALNIGGPELFFGKEYLAQSRAYVSVPYVASNLLFDGAPLPGTREYLLQKAGGLTVAVLGVFSPDDLEQLRDRELVKRLRVIPPEAALNRLLPRVRETADLVVLLSRLGAEKTRSLAEAVQGIDVAVTSGGSDIYYLKPLAGTVILQTGALGRTMGMLKIGIDETRVPRVSDNRYLSLDSAIPAHPEVAELVEQYKRGQEKRTAELKARQERELREGLRMSPEEFMKRHRSEQIDTDRRGEPLSPEALLERYRKERTEQNKGGAR